MPRQNSAPFDMLILISDADFVFKTEFPPRFQCLWHDKHKEETDKHQQVGKSERCLFQISDIIDEDSRHCFGCTLLDILDLERYRED